MKFTFLLFLLFVINSYSKPLLKDKKPVTYHVKNLGGNDKNSGISSAAAFKTIQKAADSAQPGDTVLIYQGTYRERVIPPRGGISEDKRITYIAKAGDQVLITGLDIWNTTWFKDGNLYHAKPDTGMFKDVNYIDGGNPFRISYMGNDSLSLGQVLVDGIEYLEQKNKAAADAKPQTWWADRRSGSIYLNFDKGSAGRKIEISTRRGVFRPYRKGLGYITVEGLDLAYCGNNAATPGVIDQLHPLYQSGLIGTRQGHHWRIVNNKIRNAKGLGLSFSLGIDFNDDDSWDPHGILFQKKHIEVDNPKVSKGDNEVATGDMVLNSRPYKEVGFNFIANNDFENCGMNAIAGIGGVGNTIYGNRFSKCAYLISEETAEDAVIKLHMQFGTLIEHNLFENFVGNQRAVWIDNNNPGTRISGNVFLDHKGSTPTIFFEITSSLNQYLSVVDNNIFINCDHGVVSAAADGVGFYHNLFYKCGDGISMGSNRDQSGSDYGNMRIHNWNNLFIDQEKTFGFAYSQAINKHTSDYNLIYKPKGIKFSKFLLTDNGTGKGPGGRHGVVEIKLQDITKAKTGGSYWKEGVNWGANNGPNGCESDLGYWRGTMGKTIDRHSEERDAEAVFNTTRDITFDFKNNPKIKGAIKKKGIETDFYGKILPSNPSAGPFQNIKPGTANTFWIDSKKPAIPNLPIPPTNVKVQTLSKSINKVSWINKSPDSKFVYVERRMKNGKWKFWGYVSTTQDYFSDFDIPTLQNRYEYRIATRNAAGLSVFALGKQP